MALVGVVTLKLLTIKTLQYPWPTIFWIIKNKKNLYLPSAVFIAQRLVRPSNGLKQIIQIEQNIVKNLNWLEANQLANCSLFSMKKMLL